MTQTNLPVLYLRDSVLLPYNDIRIEFSDELNKNIPNKQEQKIGDVSFKKNLGYFLLKSILSLPEISSGKTSTAPLILPCAICSALLISII